jgi:hypothetical protein
MAPLPSRLRELIESGPLVHLATINPVSEFPAPRGPGYTVRYEIDRVGGIGPWAS